MEPEKPTNRYSSRESRIMIATGCMSLLGAIAISNMELSQKAIVITIAASSGLLLLAGAMVRKQSNKA